MKVIARYIASVTVQCLTGRMTEDVPDRQTLPVFMGSAFYLVGRSGGTPLKTIGKDELVGH
jgi:hypothetical protein